MGVIQPVQWEVLVTAVSHQFPETWPHGPSHVTQKIRQTWSVLPVWMSKRKQKMKLKAIFLRDLLSKLLAKGDYEKTRKIKLEQLDAHFDSA